MARILLALLASSMLLHSVNLSAQAIGEGKYFLSRFSLKHREHKGMGYDQGYSTASLFMCPKIGIVGLPFVDGRVHVFNNEDVAANLGVGARFSNTEQSYLVGLNAYYDYRNMHWLISHQLAGGFEVLSRHIDLRINGYYPFSGKYQDDPIRFSRFKGHYLEVKHKVRYALPSADAELGWTLPDPFDQVGMYLGVGYYYLFKQKGFNQTAGNVPGVRIRLNASPSAYLSFGAEYTYDKLFRGRANGFVAVNIPLGRNRSSVMGKKTGDAISMPWIKIQTQDVVRNEIIPVLRKSHRFHHIRSDGEPLHCVFVNNQNTGKEDGTFEHPYATLGQGATAEEDVIYVFAGDGTSKGYDQGVTLKSKQVLTSSGEEISINGVLVPALTPGQLPVLTNHDQPVIQIFSPGTIINGFKIEGHGADAVYVEGAHVTLLHNEIIAHEGFSAFKTLGHDSFKEKSLLQGNRLIGQGGENASVIEIINNQSAYVLSENTIYAAEGQNGVSFKNPQNKTLVTHNKILSDTPLGIAVQYQTQQPSLLAEHECRYNTVSQGFYQAVQIDAQAETASLFEIHDNKLMSETLGIGISYESASHQGNLSVINNTIYSSQEGIKVSDQTGAINAVELVNNKLHCYSATPAISSVFSGVIDVTIEENTVSYIENIKGKFVGISSHVKEHEQGGSRLVIDRNTVNMPGKNKRVEVINERSSEMKIEIQKDESLKPLN